MLGRNLTIAGHLSVKARSGRKTHCLLVSRYLFISFLQLEIENKTGTFPQADQQLRLKDARRMEEFDKARSNMIQQNNARRASQGAQMSHEYPAASAARHNRQIRTELRQLPARAASPAPVQGLQPGVSSPLVDQPGQQLQRERGGGGYSRKGSEKNPGGRGTPNLCSICGQPKLGTHKKSGCPTHCRNCKLLKSLCTCQIA
jgi:hypothetical protein